MRKYIIGIVIGVLFASAAVVLAGNLDPSVGPTEAGSQMYTLEQIYERLDSGAAATKMDTFAEPDSGPGNTMYTLDEIMNKAPALDNTNGATTTHVLTGQTFWGLTTSQWATQTGTMPDNGAVVITPATISQTIAEGYHDGVGYVEGDAELVAGNIAQGVNLFGVDGTFTGGGGAGVPDTGQTAVYRTGDDGDWYATVGVDWSVPRFTDNGDGTVTDNLTGLIWLKNANCWGSSQNWNNAIDSSHALANGQCSLTDSSVAGDWRLPNVRELHSLIDFSQYSPALPSGHPFVGIMSAYYWSSTTRTNLMTGAWYVSLFDGGVYYSAKTGPSFVWPVRGGQ